MAAPADADEAEYNADEALVRERLADYLEDRGDDRDREPDGIDDIVQRLLARYYEPTARKVEALDRERRAFHLRLMITLPMRWIGTPLCEDLSQTLDHARQLVDEHIAIEQALRCKARTRPPGRYDDDLDEHDPRTPRGMRWLPELEPDADTLVEHQDPLDKRMYAHRLTITVPSSYCGHAVEDYLHKTLEDAQAQAEELIAAELDAEDRGEAI
jgi:hypothetical protein